VSNQDGEQQVDSSEVGDTAIRSRSGSKTRRGARTKSLPRFELPERQGAGGAMKNSQETATNQQQ
jgi:hypothetical protein